LLLLIVVLAALSLWYLGASAQDKDDQTNKGKTATVTGCLAKGDEANEFYLTTDDGKRYDLRSDKVSLADHVGHKITVTGTAVKESEESEARENPSKEAEKEAGNLQVTKVQMVSESCK
jgi:serine/threonine-protein kinase RIO1